MEIQIDYSTLTNAYQNKLNEFVQQSIFLEAKILILQKTVEELQTQLQYLDKKEEDSKQSSITSSNKRKSVEKSNIENNYDL